MWGLRKCAVCHANTVTNLPSAWGMYHPTLWDWMLLFGTVGFFATGILLFVRFLPVLSMFEMRELIADRRS